MLCTDLTLSITNSSPASTLGVVFVGLAAADDPTAFGGTLLVAPTAVLPLRLPSPGLDVTFPLPCEVRYLGGSIFLQALEVDAGASRGVSFTPGLQLEIGGAPLP